MPFKPGVSGNPSGAKPEQPFKDALRRAVVQKDSKLLRKVADKLVDQALAGEGWAIKEIADRLDGKAAQTLQGPGGGPIQATVTWQTPQ